MCSFISVFITVGVCLGIYAYIKKKYVAQIQQLEDIISNLNLDLLKYKTHVKTLDDQLFVKDREVSSFKTRLDTMVDINKELATKTKGAAPISDEPKKRGRKPGSKKPYYKKKSGGNPS